MASHALPRWDPLWSDGCSVPKILKRAMPEFERPEVRAVCVQHDEAYYYGGSEADRLRADLLFAAGLLDAGLSPTAAMTAFHAVRVGGAASLQQPGVSWAFGGGRFCYSEHPAEAKD